jgi:hypothetical protein
VRTLTERDTSNRTTVGLTAREKRLMIPNRTIDLRDEVYWIDSDLSRSTLVQPSGSQTIAITDPAPGLRLNVSSIAGHSANDISALMFPANLTIGQSWRVLVQSTWTLGQFLMSAFIMSDGVSTTSNIVGVVQYAQSGGQKRWDALTGTFTNASVSGSSQGLGQQTFPWVFELTYVGANSFSSTIYSADGLSVMRSAQAMTPTLTPTHIGVGWSNWGQNPTAPAVKFGPIYRVA